MRLVCQVIVQMSVEFAQQTEHARISKQARETSTAMQTDGTEDDEGEEEDRLKVSSRTVAHEGHTLTPGNEITEEIFLNTVIIDFVHFNSSLELGY